MAAVELRKLAHLSAKSLGSSARDLIPIVVTIAFFQALVFRKPIDSLPQILGGLALVVTGLTLFIAGLRMGLFPLGEQLAQAFARKGSLGWLLAYGFALGFGTTFAEPALIAVANRAAEHAVPDAAVEPEPHGELAARTQAQRLSARGQYALVLRSVVALAVAIALVIGVLRILKGWPLHILIMVGYLVVVLITPFAPASAIGVAYDSGGVTTSTITVPLTTALAVGLASSIRGRSPLLDGFGLIALASLTPIVFVLLLGIFWR